MQFGRGFKVILVVVPCLLVQLAALLWYSSTYIPGGQGASIKHVFGCALLASTVCCECDVCVMMLARTGQIVIEATNATKIHCTMLIYLRSTFGACRVALTCV